MDSWLHSRLPVDLLASAQPRGAWVGVDALWRYAHSCQYLYAADWPELASCVFGLNISALAHVRTFGHLRLVILQPRFV